MTELRHSLLDGAAVRHSFGTRDAAPRPEIVRPRQVHGIVVSRYEGCAAEPAEADAIVSADPACPVGVITADCVPILACSPDGRAVGAIHAGWRGLAAGIVASGIEALSSLAHRQPAELIAVIGPHIGPCCYEVDAPVVGPLRDRFQSSLDAALCTLDGDRAGHWMLDLGILVDEDLARAGLPARHRGSIPDACTRCDAERFHSYRRDGERAGRLLHWAQPALS